MIQRLDARLDKKTSSKDLIERLDMKIEINSLMHFVELFFPLFQSLYDRLHFETEKIDYKLVKRSKNTICTQITKL